jgi:hypothetical protein
VITATDYAILNQTAAQIRERYPSLKRFIVVNNDREARRYEELGLVPVTDRDAVPGLEASIAVFEDYDCQLRKWRPGFKRIGARRRGYSSPLRLADLFGNKAASWGGGSRQIKRFYTLSLEMKWLAPTPIARLDVVSPLRCLSGLRS